MSHRTVLCILLIAAATSVAYLPSLRGGFILDDDDLLTGSSLINSPDGLYRLWFTTEPLDYWPLTSTSFWLEWRLWGLNPTGYRITNLALHIAAALLIWRILSKLAIPGAFLAALLFAVHPVNAESVAWIAQRKNTLAMLFFLLSILWYLRVADARRIGLWYILSLLAFLLAMLSKGSVAILPLLLLLIAWWQRRRIDVRDIARTAPYFFVAIALTVVNVWFQRHGENIVIRDVTLAQRTAGAGAVVWFYLSKALAPLHLVFVYPPWRILTSELLWWLPLLATLTVSFILWRRRNLPETNWIRPLLLAWAFFCIALLPVLGFTDVGFMQFSLVSDHYQHIALIGVMALLAVAWSVWYRRTLGMFRAMASASAVVVALGLLALTWRQSTLYGNPVALYEQTLADYPDCWMIHNNLGLMLAREKRLDEAIPHYQQALRLRPEYPEAENNWGAALVKLDRPREALPHLEIALRLKPDSPEAHNNLGNALKQLDQLPAAIDHYQQAIHLKPDFGAAHYNLAVALDLTNKPQEAIEHYQSALRLNFDYPDVHNGLGAALARVGRRQEGIEQFEQALRVNPDDAEARNNLGIALIKDDRLPEAIENFQRIVRDNPDYAEARVNLGSALAKSGRLQEAIEQFQQAVKLKPDSLNAYTNLTKAYDLLKRPEETIAAAQKAIALARAQGKTDLADEIETWLKSYRAATPSDPHASPPTTSPSPKP